MAYDFDASQMLVHKEVYATRKKSGLEPGPWDTWMSNNTHNQRLLVVNPEGDSVAYAYEDETNTGKAKRDGSGFGKGKEKLFTVLPDFSRFSPPREFSQ